MKYLMQTAAIALLSLHSLTHASQMKTEVSVDGDVPSIIYRSAQGAVEAVQPISDTYRYLEPGETVEGTSMVVRDFFCEPMFQEHLNDLLSHLNGMQSRMVRLTNTLTSSEVQSLVSIPMAEILEGIILPHLAASDIHHASACNFLYALRDWVSRKNAVAEEPMALSAFGSSSTSSSSSSSSSSSADPVTDAVVSMASLNATNDFMESGLSFEQQSNRLQAFHTMLSAHPGLVTDRNSREWLRDIIGLKALALSQNWDDHCRREWAAMLYDLIQSKTAN